MDEITLQGQHVNHPPDFADDHFFVIPDNEAKTLTISPTEDKYTAIRLDESKAKNLANIIVRQIQKW